MQAPSTFEVALKFPLSITVALLAANVVRVTFGLDSFTEPYLTIQVAAPETGLVASIDVQEGNHVERDAVLATLDADVLQSQWNVIKENAAATAKLHSTQAEQKLRAARLEKLQQLPAIGYASPEEIHRAPTDLAIAESNLQSAKEERAILQRELEFIEAQLERRQIRSSVPSEVKFN